MSSSPLVGEFNTTPPTVTSGQKPLVQTDAQGRLIGVGAGAAGTPAGGVTSIQGVTGGTAVAVTNSGAAPVGGGITWGAPTGVAVTAGPTSTTLVNATAGRKAIAIWNPVGNAQMSVDIAGGTAVLATGLPLLAGAVLTLTGAECPVGAITFIGTAGQTLVYQQGT